MDSDARLVLEVSWWRGPDEGHNVYLVVGSKVFHGRRRIKIGYTSKSLGERSNYFQERFLEEAGPLELYAVERCECEPRIFVKGDRKWSKCYREQQVLKAWVPYVGDSEYGWAPVEMFSEPGVPQTNGDCGDDDDELFAAVSSGDEKAVDVALEKLQRERVKNEAKRKRRRELYALKHPVTSYGYGYNIQKVDGEGF